MGEKATKTAELLNKKRVCIIGAGAAGLVAIRHVISVQNFEGIVFEQSSRIGGIWVYTENTSDDNDDTKDSCITPMYKGLRTNLPKEIMGFLDFPFLNNGRGTHSTTTSYVNHTQVLHYLQHYATHFQLNQYIHFNKRVIRVKPIFSSQTGNCFNKDEESTPKWHVLVHSTQKTLTHFTPPDDANNTSKPEEVVVEEEYIFDSVIVCNGHFMKPIIPDIINIEEFQGEVLHSRDYRVPDVYMGKRVLIFGCGPSGIDISLEIAQVASEVIMSMRNPPLKSTFPLNVRQTLPIKSAMKNGFIFENDEIADDIQTLIYCSGYAYEFPFLNPDECGISVKKGKLVTPLYRHMIHTRFPSLCFIGLPFRVCPFILFDCQVRHYVKYLRGLIRLPTEEEMNTERRKDKSLRKMMGISFNSSHQLDSAQWQYFETLAQEAKFELVGPTIPPVNITVVKKIYEQAGERRRRFAAFYRNDVVHIIDEERYEYIPSIQCVQELQN